MNLYQVLLGPITTEKSVRLQEGNQHAFKVHGGATKIDVLNAIRTFYGVTPISIQIMRCPGKKRMIGRSKVFTKRRAYKKAIVRLPAGKSLELVSVKGTDTQVKVKTTKKAEKKAKEVVEKKPNKKPEEKEKK